MATLNTSHPLVVNGKLKFLAVFDEGSGEPQDLVSGEFATAADGTPGWIADPEQGFAANLTGDNYWLWEGFTHGISDVSHSILARFNLQGSTSWGGIVGIDWDGLGTTLYHHTDDNMAFDNTSSGGHTAATLPWVNGEWHNGVVNLHSTNDTISYYRDGSAGTAASHAVNGTFATNVPITVGLGQSGDDYCNGYVGLVAIFSPELTAEESAAITADPYSLIAAAGVTGTIEQTLPSLVQDLVGSALLDVTGTIAQNLPPLEQAAAGSEVITGTIDQDLPPLTQSLTGFAGFSGVIAQTFPSLRQAATGLQTIGGVISQTFNPLTQALEGTAGIVFLGTIAQRFPMLAQALVGFLTPKAHDDAVLAQRVNVPFENRTTTVVRENRTTHVPERPRTKKSVR